MCVQGLDESCWFCIAVLCGLAVLLQHTPTGALMSDVCDVCMCVSMVSQECCVCVMVFECGASSVQCCGVCAVLLSGPDGDGWVFEAPFICA
jgi:hypothetical protein